MPNITSFEEQHQILGDVLTTTSAAYTEFTGGTFAKYYIEFDPANYDNITGLFFQANIKTTAGTGSARLYSVTDAAGVGSSDVSTTSATYSRQRSSSITVPGSAKTYKVEFKTTAGSVALSGAHLVVVTGTSSTKKETTVLLSSSDSTTSTTAVTSAYRNRWLYEASKFDGTTNIYFEVTGVATSGATGSAILRDITAGSDASTITWNSTTPTLVKSGALSLTDNHEYDVQLKSSNGSTIGYGNARIRITQANFSKTQTAVDTLGTAITATSVVNIGGMVVDPTKFTDAGYQIYPEFVGYSTGGNTITADSDIANGDITITGATYTRSRGGSQIARPAGATDIFVKYSGTFGQAQTYRIVRDFQYTSTSTSSSTSSTSSSTSISTSTSTSTSTSSTSSSTSVSTSTSISTSSTSSSTSQSTSTSISTSSTSSSTTTSQSTSTTTSFSTSTSTSTSTSSTSSSTSQSTSTSTTQSFTTSTSSTSSSTSSTSSSTSQSTSTSVSTSTSTTSTSTSQSTSSSTSTSQSTSTSSTSISTSTSTSSTSSSSSTSISTSTSTSTSSTSSSTSTSTTLPPDVYAASMASIRDNRQAQLERPTIYIGRVK